jgi:hypothetical protein
VVRAAEALHGLCGSASAKQLPRCLLKLYERWWEYRADKTIQDTSAWYEQAHALLGQLRQALRLDSAGKTPMSESYPLGQEEQGEVQRDLKGLCETWRQEKERCTPREKDLCEIVLTHVERYEAKLFYQGKEKLNEELDRTTNELEQE